MKNKKWIFLLVLFNISNSFADGSYFLPGSSGGEYSENLTGELSKDDKSKIFFIPDALKEEMMKLDEEEILWAVPPTGTRKIADSYDAKDIVTDDYFIIESQKGAYYKELEKKKRSSYHFDQIPQGSPDAQTDKYIESDIYERLNENKNKGTAAFTFTILYDGNTYTDGSGIYDKTFNGDGAEWYNSFWAILSGEFYLFKSFINFAVGGNIGASYKAGYGVFAGNENKSETEFTLVTVPLDLAAIVEFNFGDLIKVEAYGGPSVMGLLQNRNDREGDEGDKSIGQVSWGYYGGARLKLSLGRMFPETNKTMFNSDEVTNYFLTFDARYQYYSNFKQDDIEVSGISGGLGLAFEFL
ncbi:MAG: hypothetical protein DRQ88_07205 [Epsilonproteobacteria bacterium]|nr:MAG: hypothetical protein DRQ89_03210 [Campylobacterota bacterium]RLA66269.1 MAG: hypothetical protein DRQ88_07205 [Campylobacterota bacterium]